MSTITTARSEQRNARANETCRDSGGSFVISVVGNCLVVLPHADVFLRRHSLGGNRLLRTKRGSSQVLNETVVLRQAKTR